MHNTNSLAGLGGVMLALLALRTRKTNTKRENFRMQEVSMAA